MVTGQLPNAVENGVAATDSSTHEGGGECTGKKKNTCTSAVTPEEWQEAEKGDKKIGEKIIEEVEFIGEVIKEGIVEVGEALEEFGEKIEESLLPKKDSKNYEETNNLTLDVKECNLAYSMALILKAPVDGNDTVHKQILRALIAAGLKILILRSTPETKNKIIVLVDPGGVDNKSHNVIGKFAEEHQAISEESSRNATFLNTSVSAESLHSEEEFTETAKDILNRERGLVARDRYHLLGFSQIDEMNEETDAATGQPPKLELTAAEELVLTHRIMVRALSMINMDKEGNIVPFHEEDDNTTEVEDVVLKMFPLQDEEWNNKFLAELLHVERAPKAENEMVDGTNPVLTWKSYVEQKSYTWTAIVKQFVLQETSDQMIGKIRSQFGDTTALYFSFLAYYTKWVNWLAAFCTAFYLIVRFVDWGHYVGLLGLIGFFTAVAWGPVMGKLWCRKNYAIQMASREHHVLLPSMYIKNPYISRATLSYTFHQRTKLRLYISLATAMVVVVNLIILGMASAFFIQWYIYGKMAPSCLCCDFFLESGIGNGSVATNASHLVYPPDCEVYRGFGELGYFEISMATDSCRAFVTCFSSPTSGLLSDRWFYILFQGIALGLTLDVLQTKLFAMFTEWLTRLESWESLALYRKHLIRKQFFFTWTNMFFWFLMLTFVYVPYGAEVQYYLRDYGYNAIVPPWGWRPDVLSLDEAFVTPMVVTALLNLIIDTFVPVLIVKASLKAKYNRRGKSHLHLHLDTKVAALSVAFVKKNMLNLERRVKHNLQQAEALKNNIGSSLAQPEAFKRISSNIPQPEALRRISSSTSSMIKDLKAKSKPTSAKVSPESVTEMETSTTAETAAETDTETETAVTSRVLDQRRKSIMQEHAQLAQDEVGPGTQIFESLCDSLAETNSMSAMNFVSLRRFTPDANMYDATEVAVQSSLSTFDENNDYLALMLQFGYISMFTTTWALLPIAAACRLWFEFRSDAFRVMFGSRRRVPLSTTTSIGEWQNTIYLTSLLAAPVVSMMLTLSTGQIDFWWQITGIDARCQSMPLVAEPLLPDYRDCSLTWGDRITVGMVIEHIGICLIILLFTQVLTVPSHVLEKREKLRTKKQKWREQHHKISNLPSVLQVSLKTVFGEFDSQHDGDLFLKEAMEMIHVLADNEAKDNIDAEDEKILTMYMGHDGTKRIGLKQILICLDKAQDDVLLRDAIPLERLIQRADEIVSAKSKTRSTLIKKLQ